MLLARLAVDTSLQGQRIGKALLKQALLKIDEAADIIGGRAVLVHALDQEAEEFYRHHGFEPSPVADETLYLLMKDMRAALKAAIKEEGK
jgi:predicted N-acetyltransferase YhbS